MKIAHFADLHFQNSAALGDIMKCTEFALKRCIADTPDLIVIAGDLFHEGVQLGSPASLAAISFARQCGDIAPTLIISGTPTHDAPGSIEALGHLRPLHPLYVTDRPEQVALVSEGFTRDMEEGSDARCLISCLPTITKANLMASLTGSISDTSRQTIDIARDMIQGWGVINANVRRRGIPTILVGHCTVTGSMLSTGQTMAGKDMELTTGDLLLAGCHVYCLGHIHKGQDMGHGIYYAGSITRLNHGETENKGFMIYDISGDRVTVTRVETPARTMKTLKPEGLPGIDVVDQVQEGELVRIVYTVAEADIGRVDEQAIIQAALDRGAADVKIEKNIVPTVRVRAEGISKEANILSKLKKWGETTGVNVDALDLKLADLELYEPEQIIAAQYEKEEEHAPLLSKTA